MTTDIIVFENRHVVLTQQPYLNGPVDAPHYEAEGTDQDGNYVMVVWNILPNFLKNTGELDEGRTADIDEWCLCEWDKPVDVY